MATVLDFLQGLRTTPEGFLSFSRKLLFCETANAVLKGITTKDCIHKFALIVKLNTIIKKPLLLLIK